MDEKSKDSEIENSEEAVYPDAPLTSNEVESVSTHEGAGEQQEEKILSYSDGRENLEAETAGMSQTKAVQPPVKKENKKKLGEKAITGIIVGAVVLVVAIIVGVVLSMQAQATEKYNEYIDNLDSLSSNGLQAASLAEGIGNTTNSVWRAAIWDADETWDADIEKYHASDFNEALAKLYADSDVKTKIANMKSYMSEVESLMGKLKNPPDPELEDAYDAAKEFASTVEDLVDLAADPSGSLQTYSTNFNAADDACAKALKKLTNEIPDKKQ